MNSDITEQFLDKLYDDLSKESSRILNDIKTDRGDNKEVYQHQPLFLKMGRGLFHIYLLKLRMCSPIHLFIYR